MIDTIAVTISVIGLLFGLWQILRTLLGREITLEGRGGRRIHIRNISELSADQISAIRKELFGDEQEPAETRNAGR